MGALYDKMARDLKLKNLAEKTQKNTFLQALPIEPFRYYSFGNRVVHLNLDGHVEVEGAYYSVPPGHIGKTLPVQWDELHVRLLDARTGQLLREHVRQARGRHRTSSEDRPSRTPSSTAELLARHRNPISRSFLFGLWIICSEVARASARLRVGLLERWYRESDPGN